MNKILINGMQENLIDVRDRGFQYGDGLFETIAYKNNKLQFWQEHMQRLQQGCERLSLNHIDESVWLADIKKLQITGDAVVKLSLSRGISGRGYAYENDHNVTRVTAVSAFPDYPETNLQGVTAIICETPVSINPVLAGIKHLNRLDNVLARNEWKTADIAEGFMFDSAGHIIEGTMSNVFCVLGNELYTPLLELCGVEGVMRQQVIKMANELNITVNIVDISKQNFLQMDALFITNSLIGIWPVKTLDDIQFQPCEMIKQLQNILLK